MSIRQPVVSVLGSVDAGKTTLLDFVRGSVVAEKEAGGITQMIDATSVPIEKIEDVCGSLIGELDTDLEIPGLLFIDTPGHAAFNSLRKRGSSLSDIAVLVIDVKDGVQPQTREAVEILRESDTPFVIALNKIDTLPGWEKKDSCSIKSYGQQPEQVQERMDDAIYYLMSDFSDLGLTVDRYDRVDDFQKKVGVVPISAETGEGVPDILMALAGLSQNYLSDQLEMEEERGEGTVLEIDEVKGFGTTIDVIVTDGTVRTGENLVVGGQNGAIVTEVKALLEPEPLEEMRKGQDFESIDEISAAAGVKVSAPELENVVAGAPFRTVKDDELEEAKEEVEEELASFRMQTSDSGVVVRADSLGSLEAITDSLAENDIPVRRAAVGKVKKQDIVEAENAEGENRAVISFSTQITEDAEEYLAGTDIEYFESDVIYQLVDDYEEWIEELKETRREAVLEKITRPAKIRVLPDHVFRQSNPAVFGIEMREGVLNSGSRLMNEDGETLGKVKAIQEEGESIGQAVKGDQVAVSVTDVTVGRQVEEGDELYTDVTGKDFRIIQEMEEEFSTGELRLLEDIVDIKDKVDPRWKIE
ncbi:MAG: translation initiation factor IF-2 [Candidatus Nanohaloarchaeota archaeon QJJ-7]|nr:translation initiation factor IF-2 [Candidatus Nanohaloarchaeota archaeon QJJ-7]